MDLDGKVALVTGSAKRIGKAIACQLANAGADIALHYRNSQSEAQETGKASRSNPAFPT